MRIMNDAGVVLCVAFSVLLPATGTAAPLTFQQGDYGLASTESGDGFGSSLAIGDFDCSGTEDLAVGAPGEDYGAGSNEGVVSVHYFSSVTSAPSGLPQVIWQSGGSSPESGDGFGSRLAVGDFDGDGCADLAAASATEDWGSTQRAGMIHLYEGGGSGLSYSGYLNENNAGNGVETDALFGYALAVGDYNADGYDDLAIGEGGLSVLPSDVHIVYGSAAGLDTSTAVTFSQADTGAGIDERGDAFGSALAAGDFDGDNFDDLAIGAFGERLGSHYDTGYVTVVYSDGLGIDYTDQQSFSYSTMGTRAGYEQFGGRLASGDFDGAYGDDLLVAAFGADSTEGEVGVFYSDGADLGAVPDVISTPLPGYTYGFGYELAVGDLDQDGDDDFAVQALGYDYPASNAGIVWVFENSASGFVVGSFVTEDMAGFSDADAEVGSALAVGDLQGTGALDLVVGMRGVDSAAGVVHMRQPL